MINRTISLLKLRVQILPNLFTLLRIISQYTYSPHIQILILSIISMIIQILILINTIRMNNSRLIALSMICAWIVYHESFKIES